MALQYSIVSIYHIFFTYSSVEGHKSSFQLLDIMNKPAMKNVGQMSVWSDGASFWPSVAETFWNL